MNSSLHADNHPVRGNPNIEWAAIFVEELARSGLKYACLAPGSRSTPLALAFYTNPDIKVYTHLDERSAAFFALGMAMAEEEVVALLCTSGTAAANFYPAIVEANMSQIPLLVLTADRPHELRHSGANQTIDQVKMFGDHVLWSVDMALPQASVPENVLRHVRTMAARAIALSNGLVKGPVHFNFPFRKPLEPVQPTWPENLEPHNRKRPYTIIERGTLLASEAQIDQLSKYVDQYSRGLIICGPGCMRGEFPEAAAMLSRASGYPLLADPLSGVRFGAQIADTAVIGGYETFLQVNNLTWSTPEIILRFGRVPTSKWLNAYLQRNQPALHIHIRENGKWADDGYTTTNYLQAQEDHVCNRVAQNLCRKPDVNWLSQWQNAEKVCQETVDQMSKKDLIDAVVPQVILEQLADGGVIFAGNSLPIRHIDQFCLPRQEALNIYSNRGASGIDGNISTGLGIAAREEKPVVLLVGDITFYHDSNGLLAINKFGIENVIIIVLNNNGGGIFRRLPISKFDAAFEELFLTSHGLNFAAIADQYGLDYYSTTTLAGIRESFAAALSKKAAAVIEIQTDGQVDERERNEIIAIVNSKL